MRGVATDGSTSETSLVVHHDPKAAPDASRPPAREPGADAALPDTQLDALRALGYADSTP